MIITISTEITAEETIKLLEACVDVAKNLVGDSVGEEEEVMDRLDEEVEFDPVK